MTNKLLIGAVGALIGAGLVVLLSTLGAMSFAKKGAFSVSMEISKERANKMSMAINNFSGERVMLSDKVDFFIQCPGSKPDSCDLRLDRNQ